MQANNNYYACLTNSRASTAAVHVMMVATHKLHVKKYYLQYISNLAGPE